MSVHSGGRPVDPDVLAATQAALGQARAAVVVITRAVQDGDRVAAATAVVGYLTVTADPVRYSGRVNALLSVLLQTAAQVITAQLANKSGAVISIIAPAGSDATRRAAWAAVSCAANGELGAAVDVLLAHAAAQECTGGPRAHRYAEVVLELCLATGQLAGDGARGSGDRS